MKDYSDLIWTLLIGVAAVALVGFLIYGSVLSSREWEAFKVAHKCKIVSTMSGDVFNTFSVGANGQPSFGIGMTSEKKGWSCDDGVTYWK